MGSRLNASQHATKPDGRRLPHANADPATRNLITSTNKKSAFGEWKHFLSLFIDCPLEGNLSVPDDARRPSCVFVPPPHARITPRSRRLRPDERHRYSSSSSSTTK